jgi:hypothetical protein
MMKYYVFRAALGLGILAGTFGAAQAADALRIDISNVRNANGHVGCYLFNSADGFPSSHAKAYKFSYVTINSGAAVCEFKDIAPGTYAAIVYHDENDNQEIDKNFTGIPQEGYIASNNVRPMFSAPGFPESSFKVDPGTPAVIQVKMGY